MNIYFKYVKSTRENNFKPTVGYLAACEKQDYTQMSPCQGEATDWAEDIGQNKQQNRNGLLIANSWGFMQLSDYPLLFWKSKANRTVKFWCRCISTPLQATEFTRKPLKESSF